VVTNILWVKMKWLAKAVGAAAKIGKTASRVLMATIMRVEVVEEDTGKKVKSEGVNRYYMEVNVVASTRSKLKLKN
jgi:hypothetical protein